MHIGHISFRLAGTDGVSLETAKIVTVLNQLGHENYYFAGELDNYDSGDGLTIPEIDGSMLAPEAHFTYPEAMWITKHAFGTGEMHPELHERIETLSETLETKLRQFIDRYEIDFLTVQNVLSIPMNLALSLAICRVIKESRLPVIAHNHDFYWEREIYKNSFVSELLETCFPPKLKNVHQVVINSQAQRELNKRGFKSTVLPNIFDFKRTPPGKDTYNSDLRTALGLEENDLFFLQPTRVVPRKGIELAIELVHRMADRPIKFVITHSAEYNSRDYLDKILTLAEKKKVDLIHLPSIFEPQRQNGKEGQKIYSLWDAYIYADFVTYPSSYEGFGNALLETIYFRKPFLINRYLVYREDIEPYGMKAVTIEGKIEENTVNEVREVLNNPGLANQMTENNFQVASQHFSYEKAKIILVKIFQDLLGETKEL